MVRFDIRNWCLESSPRSMCWLEPDHKTSLGGLCWLSGGAWLTLHLQVDGYLMTGSSCMDGSCHPLSMCAYPKQHIISRRDLLIVQGFINCPGGFINCSGIY